MPIVNVTTFEAGLRGFCKKTAITISVVSIMFCGNITVINHLEVLFSVIVNETIMNRENDAQISN